MREVKISYKPTYSLAFGLWGTVISAPLSYLFMPEYITRLTSFSEYMDQFENLLLFPTALFRAILCMLLLAIGGSIVGYYQDRSMKMMAELAVQ